ncbi:rhodanese-like domain-containing protein [Mycobacterium sp. CVI_P3]|uniref:Rhodanese-like domain-containing protein n=1 Tax=Mycobacterium pinniadriaticum TaxID=2994102 RepID=A0ABT3SPJ2_9MYCO|nr:rhodanese-like domain-containing protein [Mycobacterium pinniadriaticum]MCX2935006.1 rhodanese-like domain-containing protein [Mycobacterium pinniadriaticum]MCX2941431.1 rhodanese-like domain-containing protein [Mycobacterium pinniadriaticum]
MTAPSPTTITAGALQAQLAAANPPRMLDVRTPGEFETVHIPGAYNVPLDLLREHRDEIRNHLTEQVVLVCRSGQRAAQAEEALRAAGLANVHILEGGMNAWEAGGLEVNRGAQRWELERQVRLVAGLIVALSVLVGVFVPGAQWVAFVMGAGLAAAAATNTCLMGMMLAKLPYNRGPKCDADEIVAQLVTPTRR